MGPPDRGRHALDRQHGHPQGQPEQGHAAQRLIDFYYDPATPRRSRRTSTTCARSRARREVMVELDPTLAKNPLIFPTPEMGARLHDFRVTTAEEEAPGARRSRGHRPVTRRARGRDRPSGAIAPYAYLLLRPACSTWPCSTCCPRSRCSWSRCGPGASSDGLPADLELRHLPGADRRVLAEDRPVDRVRRAGHPAHVRARLPARVLHRVPRWPLQEPAAVPGHRTVLHELPAAHHLAGRSSSPTTASSSDRSRTSACCPRTFRLLATPIAVIAGITYNFLPFMTLPLYVALEKIPPSLLEAAQDLYADRLVALPPGHASPALPGRRRRLAADVHPGGG